MASTSSSKSAVPDPPPHPSAGGAVDPADVVAGDGRRNQVAVGGGGGPTIPALPAPPHRCPTERAGECGATGGDFRQPVGAIMEVDDLASLGPHPVSPAARTAQDH